MSLDGRGQVGKTCAMLNNCEGLWSWPQGKLWIRIAYTFFFFVLISAVCLEVKLAVTMIPTMLTMRTMVGNHVDD